MTAGGYDNSAQIFSSEWIRKVIRDEVVLDYKYLIPDIEKLWPLSVELNKFCAIFNLQNNPHKIDSSKIYKRIEESIAFLTELLPHPIRQLTDDIDFFGKFTDGSIIYNNMPNFDLNNHTSNYLRPNLEKIEELLRISKEVYLTYHIQSMNLTNAWPIEMKWHEFSPCLATLFREAVRAENPKLAPLKSSNKGPVVRFLAAVIPHITGETPELGAIAKYLGRKVKGDNTE